MEYRIVLIDFPCGVNGTAVMDEDGFVTIYINAKLSYIEQREAIKHELTHFKRDDFYKLDEPLEAVERMKS